MMQIKFLNISSWLFGGNNRSGLKELQQAIKADENDPYEKAKKELEEELGDLEERSEDLDKKIILAMHRLKKVDSMYQKVSNGGVLNDLEAHQLKLVRIKR